MSNRLLIVSAAVACGFFATQASAAPHHHHRSGAQQTDASRAQIPANHEDYRALSPETAAEAPAGAAASGPHVTFGPDGYPLAEKDSVMFRHASGTMGAP